MDYYLGLDAGGTKTFCLIADEQGRIKGFGRAGSGNYEVHGVEPAAIENRNAVEAALADAGLTFAEITSIGMGIAGADLPEDYDMLEQAIFTPLFGDTPRVFRNDSMAGLRGGTRQPYGIVVACGTGCVCAGVNRAGDHARVGGLGEEFGDRCTGSGIGRHGLESVWRARDGIVGETSLTDQFVRRAGCRDVEELFYKYYRQEIGYEDLEPMAKLVFDAAFDGDATACDILEQGGSYLGAMANAVGRHLGVCQETFEVVMAGSVFKGGSPVLVDAMRTAIHRQCPKARLVMPIFEPVVGALLLGMEQCIEVSEELYDRLSEDLVEAEGRYEIKFRAS